MPHATLSLWPMTTPGRPEKVKPETWNGHAALSVRHWRLTWPQMPGIDRREVRVVGEQRLARRRARSPRRPTSWSRCRRRGRGSTGTASTEASAESMAALPSDGAHRREGRGRGAGRLVALRRRRLPVLLREDRLVAVDGIGRVEQVDLLDRARRAREAGAGQLVLVVAAQVPRHRLEPRERVDGRPRLDAVAGVAAREHGVLERHLLGRLGLLDVRVDAVGVRLEVLPGLGRELGQLLLGDAAPAHRADDLVAVDARRCRRARTGARP